MQLIFKRWKYVRLQGTAPFGKHVLLDAMLCMRGLPISFTFWPDLFLLDLAIVCCISGKIGRTSWNFSCAGGCALSSVPDSPRQIGFWSWVMETWATNSFEGSTGKPWWDHPRFQDPSACVSMLYFSQKPETYCISMAGMWKAASSRFHFDVPENNVWEQLAVWKREPRSKKPRAHWL